MGLYEGSDLYDIHKIKTFVWKKKKHNINGKNYKSTYIILLVYKYFFLNKKNVLALKFP